MGKIHFRKLIIRLYDNKDFPLAVKNVSILIITKELLMILILVSYIFYMEQKASLRQSILS